MRGRLAAAAGRIAAELGPARGSRLLHVTDLHNRPAAFARCQEPAHALPDSLP